MTTSNLTLSRVAYAERVLENEGRSVADLLRIGLDGTGIAPNTTETALGLTAGDIAAQCLELALRGYVTFKRSFTCSTNDSVTLELIARGVTASAGSYRRIDVLGSAGDDAGVATFHRRYGVLGATTPVLDVFGGSTGAAVQTTSGLTTVDVDLERTEQAAAEAQTLAMAAGSSTLTITYTGQSGDVTTGFFEVRVYPKNSLTLV
jgi:hypothetical protein